MKNSVIYIVGATVLVGGAYLFLKNKKAKDLAELDTLGGTTSGGTTSDLSTTSDGVAPSDANINLSNATVLVFRRRMLYKDVQKGDIFQSKYKSKLEEIDKKLATLGYKVDNNTGLLIKIGVNSNDVNLNLANANLIFQERRKLPTTKIWRKMRENLDQKLAGLGYKVDAIGQLVKI